MARRDRDRVGALPRALPVAACAALAAASLLLPSTPTYDPWLWLVWGREVAQLELDTRAFGSWKPLPVLVTTPLSLLGGAAPALWLVVTRTAGLLAMLLAHRLAARMAGPIAGAVAVVVLVLAPGPDAGWVYYLAQGTSETLVTAAVLLAILRHLDGRHGQALALGTLAGLARPEAWPLLVLYGGRLLVADPRRRRLVAALAGLLVLLWLGGDWWGAGAPLRGAEVARGGGPLSPTLDDLRLAVLTAARVVVAPAWPAVAYAVLRPGRRPRTERLLAAGALAWLGVVVAMAGLDFAAQARFMMPAAAVLAVLAGVGTARGASLLGGARSARWRRIAPPVLLTMAVAAVVPRAGAAGEQLPAAARRAEVQRDLAAVLRRAGERYDLLRCPPLAVQNVAGSYTAAAWRLRVRLEDVRWLEPQRPAEGIMVVYGRSPRATRRGERVLATAGRWSVIGVSCPPSVRRG